MDKRWNRKVTAKDIEGRAFVLQLTSVHQFSRVTGTWEILSGVVTQDVSDHGERERYHIICRFECRIYSPYKQMQVQLTPRDSRVREVFTSFNIDQEISIDWIHEKLIEAWKEQASNGESRDDYARSST